MTLDVDHPVLARMTALSLPGVDTLPPEKLRQKALSQWFTPHDLARRLVSWAGSRAHLSRVLEPSAGDGAIVGALLEAGAEHVDAVELDPRFARRRWPEGVAIECCDYLQRPAPAERYPLCVMNPPYEDGADGAFLAKAMDESDRVIALLRLNALTGKGRHERVWSRCEREWFVTGVAYLISRPSFTAAGASSDSPLSDFVAVKLRRKSLGVCLGTESEWWTANAGECW